MKEKVKKDREIAKYIKYSRVSALVSISVLIKLSENDSQKREQI